MRRQGVPEGQFGPWSNPTNKPCDDPWLVDPADRTLEAFVLHDGQWLLIVSAKDDDPISIQPFDAITFSLGDLWP